MQSDRWQYLRLANKLKVYGHDISERELDILLMCNENPLTPKELIANTRWTRKPIYDSVNELTSRGLLRKENLRGGNAYYITAIAMEDIEAEDFGVLRLNIKGTSVSVQKWIQELLPNLPMSEYIVRRAFSEAIHYLWAKSKYKNLPEQIQGPTSPEVKAFLIATTKNLQQLIRVYEQALNMSLFDNSQAIHKLVGELKEEGNDKREIMQIVSDFRNRWEKKAYNTQGIHPGFRVEREEWEELLDKFFGEKE